MLFIHKCDVLVEAKTAVDDSDTFTSVLLSLFELDYYYKVGTAEKTQSVADDIRRFSRDSVPVFY